MYKVRSITDCSAIASTFASRMGKMNHRHLQAQRGEEAPRARRSGLGPRRFTTYYDVITPVVLVERASAPPVDDHHPSDLQREHGAMD